MHYQKWKAQRKGEHTVLNRVALAHRTKLCQHLELPKHVKEILQKPQDETNWQKLEELRKAILLAVEGEEYFLLESQEEAEALAAAVEGCPNGKFPDEVGEGCKVPCGSRIRVVENDKASKTHVAHAVRNLAGEWVRVLTRPFHTCRAPVCDHFCSHTLAAGRECNAETIANDVGLSKESLLDKMLLCLFDALFLKQSVDWTARGVANLPADETPEIAKWFMKGQKVGAKPIFDGTHPTHRDCS